MEKNESSKDIKKNYESQGVYNPKMIQDYPIRGKAVDSLIKRRRWRHKDTRQQLKIDYSIIVEGYNIND